MYTFMYLVHKFTCVYMIHDDFYVGVCTCFVLVIWASIQLILSNTYNAGLQIEEWLESRRKPT